MNHSEALAELRSGKIRPVYLIYGGEPFLEEEIFREIRKALVQPETADFNYHVIDAAPDQVQRTLSVAQTQPFFADRRLVVMRDCPLFTASRKGADEEEGDEEKPAGSGEDLLIQYLKSPVASTCLIILATQGADSRKKVTKAAIATGGAVDCKPLKDQDCLMWTQLRAKAYGKHLGDMAARLLMDKLGTDLRLIDSELQKLTTYIGQNREITPADVDVAVGGVAETEIFRLTEAVMLKQRGKALELLERMLRQVDHPLQLLAALTGRFRQMLMVKALVARGVSIKEGAGMAKMHPFPYEKMVGYLRNYPREEIVDGLSKLLEADIAMKSGFDARLTIEAVVVELLG